ncbi:MAG TPA: hypothetical protein VGM78_08340 [Ilumatobacteraceae bacterium]
MTELSALDAARQLAAPIGEAGSKWMLSPETLGPCKDAGYPHGFVYYVRGRAGVLGEVDADVVIGALGFFEPGLIRKMWDLGVGVEDARAAGARYGLACAEYGRKRLGEFAGADRFATLAAQLADAAPVQGLALFAGWRSEPRPDDGPGRAYFLTHVLRELRGSAHVVAGVSSGLAPLDSILTRHGAGQAKLFGWGEDFDDVSHLTDLRADVEDLTDRICAAALERALDPSERGELVALTTELHAAIVAQPG